ncbi:bifunctional copper resistance protein CopD/cytochrome c oxidase assembly protein [Glycomyces sp. TRM65418]|uniref:cytochrome c oxidase assembly protein n=1 Tax=Glycomyces sp. TRM65418 TaxID=2867006 RepID=UPI001CE56C3F|nr:cytochrome c oxidase assembly protein [Glycomyces sp. TRM65418]MCC3763974.1 bifunctional copper resistance protein CopD/cytochrome c oxidase assembly protein [Glycomyces sp. TRM65418]QZD53671.1 bifunctional copper resistance protein CopD/cytochrome c oxidase assembly protein [Glycomyces sp. TRM65418]
MTASTETSQNTAATIPGGGAGPRSGLHGHGRGPQGPGRGLRALAVAAAVLAGLAAAVVALDLGGAVDVDALPGLTAPDPAVTWAAGLLKYAYDLAMLAAVGCMVAAACFLPGRQGDRARLTAQSWRWLRVGAAASALWAVVALVRLPVEAANLNAVPLDRIGTQDVWFYVSEFEQGRALALAALLALAAAVLALRAFTIPGAVGAAALAVAATFPPVFTGHSASNGNHQIAVDGLLIHVVAAAFWAGGLFALFIARKDPAVAARRYSRTALFAYAAVGGSGLIVFCANVALTDLWTTPYGRIALAKLAVLAAGGLLGWAHRRRALPAVAAGDRRAFTRLAAAELALMAIAFGLAASLSVTPPPAEELADPNTAVLGFPTPGPLSVASVALDWYPSILFCTAAIALVGAYVAGVVRLRRRGDAWPWYRTALWIAGWVALVVTTSSGLGKYGMVLFSAHMVQHMALNMLVPILLVLAAPVTLALRALRPDRAGGPREWLLAAVHSRWSRFVSKPLVALFIYLTSLYLMYFTGMFEWALRSHFGHLFMTAHFLAAGSLFFWVIIGPDPKPRPLSYPAKVLLYFVSIVFHAIFGLTLMLSTTLIAGDWYTQIAMPWAGDLLADQRAGGGIAWAFGEIPSLIIIGVLIAQWTRSEDREGRRLDRMAERATASGRPEDDPHEVYNAYLASLDQERR